MEDDKKINVVGGAQFLATVVNETKLTAAERQSALLWLQVMSEAVIKLQKEDESPAEGNKVS
jgi:hypothetical protein